ncbi:MAG TPA: hypothetical protein PKD24_06415 [Pyrinomonadaceae bacterium]|nr:hypothetical protein [Pyrinomonadaceae bacterium]HMP65209.1 hypothetical protein [Pyrinomonadaceae bacterium]
MFTNYRAHFSGKILAAIVIIVFISTQAIGQSEAPDRVFIAEMGRGFENYLMAAIVKNKLPVVIVTEESEADYIIEGVSARGPHRFYDTIWGASRDREQGSVRLVRMSDKVVVWAGAAGDKSLWFGSFKNGGQAKVANRLARQMNKEFFLPRSRIN